MFGDKMGRGALYILTDKGESALTTKPPTTANGLGGSNPQSLPPAPPSLEGAQQVVVMEIDSRNLPWDDDLLYEQAEREAMST